MNNNKTRTALAALAGAAVLFASGATFALWQDDATLAGADISTGTLYLTSGENFVWTDESPDGPGGGGIDITDDVRDGEFLLVPGDLVVGTAEGADNFFEYGLDGTNIEAVLEVRLYDEDGAVADTLIFEADEFSTAYETVFTAIGAGFEDYGLTITGQPVGGDFMITIDWTDTDDLPTLSGTAGGVNLPVLSLDNVSLTLQQVRG